MPLNCKNQISNKQDKRTNEKTLKKAKNASQDLNITTVLANNRGGKRLIVSCDQLLIRGQLLGKGAFHSTKITGSKFSEFSFSTYVPRKPRNGELAKMGSFYQRKRSDNK